MQVIQALRDATTHLHQRLDAAVSRQPIETRAGYARFLSMHAQVLPGAERWLAKSSDFQTLPDFRKRLRADALNKDLEAFGISGHGYPDMSFLNDGSSVAGICYVLEGSRLGAAHLCSMLDKSDASFPTAFLRHGREHSHWKTYLVWLASQDASLPAIERAISSARLVFECYLKALDAQDNNRMHSVGTS